jgi:hypothetical protein
LIRHKTYNFNIIVILFVTIVIVFILWTKSQSTAQRAQRAAHHNNTTNHFSRKILHRGRRRTPPSSGSPVTLHSASHRHVAGSGARRQPVRGRARGGQEGCLPRGPPVPGYFVSSQISVLFTSRCSLPSGSGFELDRYAIHLVSVL